MITDFRLQVFVTVARELSFTRAAEVLSISQPAVTKHIKELERLFSVALFRRIGNRISLTKEASHLLPYAKSVLDSYVTLGEVICDISDVNLDNGYFGRLHIGASTTIEQYLLPALLAKFKMRYPNIELSLESANSEMVLRALEQERIDLGMVEDAHISTAFRYEHLSNDRVVLVTANGKHDRTIVIEDIVKLPLILRENGSGTLGVVERMLERYHITRRALSVVMQIGSSEGIVRYLKESRCYAFISESAVREHLRRGDLHVVDIEGLSIERTFRFVSLRGVTNRLAELFINFCRESV